MHHSLIRHLRKAMRAARESAPFVLIAMALGLAVEPAFAVLPTVVTPTGVSSGDYLGMSGDFIKKALLLMGLVIAAAGFTVVAGGAIGRFNEYRIGKAEMGAVASYVVLGALLLLIIVYLLTEAAGVM